MLSYSIYCLIGMDDVGFNRKKILNVDMIAKQQFVITL